MDITGIINFETLVVDTTADWSLIIVLLGGIAYFFGKLVSDVRPSKENPFWNYFSGGIFVVQFVMIPLGALYYLPKRFWLLPMEWALPIQFALTLYLVYRLSVFITIQRMCRETVALDMVQKTAEVKLAKSPRLQKHTSGKQIKTMVETLFFSKMPTWLLIVFALFNYYFTCSVLLSETEPIWVIFSSLVLLISLISLAVLHTAFGTKYPEVKAHLDNGKTISGKLSKIEDGYVNLIENGTVYHIKDEHVVYIEGEILVKPQK